MILAAPTVCAMTRRNDLHPAVWLMWAAAGTVIATVAGNPLTSLMVIMIAIFTTRLCGREPFARLSWIMFGLAAAFGVMRIALLALTSHGVGTVWFQLPSVHIPKWLGDFELGGTVESRVLAQAAAEVLLPIAIMCLFAAFNAIVDHDRLMSLIPRSLARPAIVASMALRFFPALVTNVHEARTAARARAGSLRSTRRSVVGPALARTVAQSAAVGESMELRGFPTHMAGQPRPWAAPTLLTTSAVAMMIGFARNDVRWSLAAVLFAAGGIGMARSVSKRTPALRASVARWTAADALVLFTLIGTVVFIAIATRHGAGRWFPTEPLTWPQLDRASTLAVAMLVVPMVAQTARTPMRLPPSPSIPGAVHS